MDALLFVPVAVAIALTPGPNNFCGLNNGIRAGIGVALVGGGALLLGLLALWLFKPWHSRTDLQQRLFNNFERVLARHAVPRAAGEGPRHYAQRAARQLPKQAALINDFIAAWEAQRYAGRPTDNAQLKHALRRLRRALPWRFTRL